LQLVVGQDLRVEPLQEVLLLLKEVPLEVQKPQKVNTELRDQENS
jgi:hypothetical protein